MKRVGLIIGGVIFALGLVTLVNYSKPTLREGNIDYSIYARPNCEEPIQYTLGDIDPRFDISNDEIIQLLKEAEGVWEQGVGENLFAYTPTKGKGVVNIDFIFDERQERVLAEKQSSKELQDRWKHYDDLVDAYNNQLAQHNNRVDQYNQDLAQYEIRLQAYNQRVEDWNQSSRTSRAELAWIQAEEQSLRAISQELETRRRALNAFEDDLNKAVSELNELHNNLSNQTNYHNTQYNTGEEVIAGDQGAYTIHVYQYYSTAELRAILAHEMGHALGIDHLDDDKAIMHYLAKEQNFYPLQLTPSDVAAVHSVCNFSQ